MERINRRDFLRSAARGTAAVSLAGLTAEKLAAKPNKAKRDRPNILFVFADQLRYSALGSSGNKMVVTPNLDKLASQGVVFDQAFASSPICAPYRANIYTGQYGHKNGVLCNEYKMRTDRTTIFHVLKEAGYYTGFIGKWHLGYGPYTKEKRYGLDYMFAHNCQHRNYYDTFHYENERGPFRNSRWSPEVETDKAIEFIERQCRQNPEAPFSLFVGWSPPHTSYGGRRHRGYDQYPGKYNVYHPDEIELRPNVPWPLRPVARDEIADYYGNVTGLDDQMGRLMAKLEELGIADNTIVCFSSDHGDHMRSHGYGDGFGEGQSFTTAIKAHKCTPLEESIHIPFILRWPSQIKGGRRTETMFGSINMMPTLLSLCGLDIPEGVQGKDLAWAVKGEKGTEPDSVYLMIQGRGWIGRKGFAGLWRGLRTKRWVYARWHDNEFKPMLFDRKNDPYEMKNLAGKKEYAEIQAKLENRLRQWIKETDDPFDSGQRDPESKILQVGQEYTHEKYYRKPWLSEIY